MVDPVALPGRGVSEADEGFADIPWHGEMNFLSGVVPFDGESTVPLPVPVA